MGRGGNSETGNMLYGEAKSRSLREQVSQEDSPQSQQVADAEDIGVRQVFIQNNVKIAPERLEELTQPITLERQQIQQMQITPTNIKGMLMIETNDDYGNPNEIFFVREKDLKKAADKPRAYENININTPAYQYLNDHGAKVLEDQPAYQLYDFQNDDNDLTFEDTFASKDQVKNLAKKNKLDLKRLIHFHSDDHAVWPVDGQQPLSTVQRIEYGSKDFDVDKLAEHLEKDARIKSVEKVDVPSYNHDYSGEEELIVDYKLPQDLYNAYYHEGIEKEQLRSQGRMQKKPLAKKTPLSDEDNEFTTPSDFFFKNKLLYSAIKGSKNNLDDPFEVAQFAVSKD